jgi:hypothetical protein
MHRMLSMLITEPRIVKAQQKMAGISVWLGLSNKGLYDIVLDHPGHYGGWGIEYCCCSQLVFDRSIKNGQ